MKETYKMMNEVLDDKYSKMNNEELATLYKQKENPSILAQMFCNNYKFLCSIYYRPTFSKIDSYDREDIILERLHHSMQCYDESKGFKFLTIANKIIVMELYLKLQYLNKSKRTGDIYSLDKMLEETDNEPFEENFQKKDDFTVDTFELKMNIQAASISETEKRVCLAIIDNPGITNVELSEKLKVHTNTIGNIKKNLRQKLSLIMC